MTVDQSNKSPTTYERMTAPFPVSDIRWRQGSYNPHDETLSMLPYVTARAIQVRLDEVFTPFGWKLSFNEVVSGSRLTAVRCALEVLHEGQWIAKEDAAHVDHSKSKVEMSIKGAYSDALKRAAVQWGIGRYLHDLSAKAPAVPCSAEHKRDYAIYTPLIIPEVPPDFAIPSEREAQQGRWDKFLEELEKLTASQAQERRTRQEQQLQEAGYPSAEAHHRVEDIATGARDTHVPRTDSFSVRESLVPPRSARPQVAPGAEPTSVTELLGSTARARAGIRTAPAQEGSDNSTEKQAAEAEVLAASDTQDAAHVVLEDKQVQVAAESAATTSQTRAEPETVVKAETPTTPPTTRSRTSRTQNPEHAAEDARIAEAAQKAAAVAVEQARAQAQAQAIQAASASKEPAPEKQADSTSAPAVVQEKPSSPTSPTSVNEGPREQPAEDKPIAAESDATVETWQLDGEDNKDYYDDIVKKLVTGSVPKTMLVNYMNAPRTKQALSERTRAFLSEKIRTHR